MVTRKTRLLSAFAAVLMLVSLFSAFVLPAVADDETGLTAAALKVAQPDAPVEWVDLVAYKDRTEGDGVTNYAITDVTDWLIAVADSNQQSIKSAIVSSEGKKVTALTADQTFAGITLWFTADLDFAGADFDTDGDNTEEPLEMIMCGNSTGAFAGNINGQGHVIKNLDISRDSGYTYSEVQAAITKNSGCTSTATRYMGLIGYMWSYSVANKVVRDLGLDSTCSFTINSGWYRSTSSTSVQSLEAYVGAFTGMSSGYWFINCWNGADVTVNNRNDGSGKTSTGCPAAFGRTGYDATQVGGFINCLNSGNIIENCGSNRASAITDWVKGTCYIYNTANIGKVSASSYKSMVLFKSGSDSSYLSKAALYNVNTISSDEGAEYGVIDYDQSSKYPTGYVGLMDYATGASGELAWTMNKNYTVVPATHLPAGVTVDRVYWTMDNGNLVYGTAANQTVKVRLNYEGKEVGVGYVNMNESTDLSSFHDIEDASYSVDSEFATFDGSSITVKNAPTTDLTVEVNLTSTALQYSELDEAIAFYTGKNTEYYVDSEGNKLTDEYKPICEEMENYTTQDQINAAVARLAEFSFNEEQLVPVSEFETYKDVVLKISVASKEDLEKVADIVKNGEVKFTAAQTLYIIKDIDFGGKEYTGAAINLGALKAGIDGSMAEGGVATIRNLYTPRCWIGDMTKTYDYSYVPFLKNLKFYDCHSTETADSSKHNSALVIGATNVDCEIENVTLDNCSADLSGRGPSVAGGLLIGRAGNFKLKLTDITIKNCKLDRGNYDGKDAKSSYVNVGFVLGKGSASTDLDVNNLYMIGNEIAGLRRGLSAGIAFGEIVGPISVKNAGIFNTTIEANDGFTPLLSTSETDSNIKGILIGQIKDSAATQLEVENVITANNKVRTAITTTDEETGEITATGEYKEEKVPLIYNTDNISGVDIKNVYTDASTVRRTAVTDEVITAATANAGAAITSGEAAWALNNAGDTRKWMMDGTTPAFSKEGKQTVKVTVKYDGMETCFYANTAEDISLGDVGSCEVISGTATLENGILRITEPEDVVLKLNNESAHTHKLAYKNNKDGTHTPYCTYEATVGELAFACDYEEETVNCTDLTYEVVEETIDQETHAHQYVAICKNCEYAFPPAPCTEDFDEYGTHSDCMNDGAVAYYCKTCDYTYTVYETATGHSEKYIHIEGTQTHNVVCENENDALLESDVPCAAAEDAVWTETKAPSKTEEGEETAKCALCEGTVTRSIPKLVGIDVTAELSEDETTVNVTVDPLNLDGVTLTVEVSYPASAMTIEGGENGKVTATVEAGTALSLTFEMANNAANMEYEIGVTVTGATDRDGRELSVDATESATFTYTKGSDFLKGDLTNDGVISIADAVLLLRYVNEKLEGATEATIASYPVTDAMADLYDEDTNPGVNVNDVIQLLRYLNGQITTL